MIIIHKNDMIIISIKFSLTVNIYNKTVSKYISGGKKTKNVKCVKNMMIKHV